MIKPLKTLLLVALLPFTWAIPISDVFAQVKPLYGTVNGFEIVPDTVPVYPGGDAAMFKFISRQMRYPAEAIEEGIQGKVLVSFIVDEKGSLTSVKIEQGMHPDLDCEAHRVISLAQGWKPAYANGQPVKYRKIVPVKFVLR